MTRPPPSATEDIYLSTPRGGGRLKVRRAAFHFGRSALTWTSDVGTSVVGCRVLVDFVCLAPPHSLALTLRTPPQHKGT
ncbi:hypothetical protein AGIG_G18741 [Arapaima gigas]